MSSLFSSASSYRPELTIGEYNRSESATTEKFSTTDYKVIIHPEYIHQYYCEYVIEFIANWLQKWYLKKRGQKGKDICAG